MHKTLTVPDVSVSLCRSVCAEAFNPDEDEEDKEPRVQCFMQEN